MPYDRREREDERDFAENHERALHARMIQRREMARALGIEKMVEGLVKEFGKKLVQETLDACEDV